VVFTSDHGDYMGEHGLTGKNMLYETAFRVPTIVRWPKSIPGGRRVREIVSTVDFAPTVLSLMGVRIPRRMQGSDGSHLLLGKAGRWDGISYSYHSSNDCAGLFTSRYQLAVSRKGFSLKSAPERMLYDRREDPDQRRNLVDAPEHEEMVAEMTARILRHHRELETPAAAWLKDL
jgi:arylsulfatase A-like enzyme